MEAGMVWNKVMMDEISKKMKCKLEQMFYFQECEDIMIFKEVINKIAKWQRKLLEAANLWTAPWAFWLGLAVHVGSSKVL